MVIFSPPFFCGIQSYISQKHWAAVSTHLLLMILPPHLPCWPDPKSNCDFIRFQIIFLSNDFDLISNQHFCDFAQLCCVCDFCKNVCIVTKTWFTSSWCNMQKNHPRTMKWLITFYNSWLVESQPNSQSFPQTHISCNGEWKFYSSISQNASLFIEIQPNSCQKVWKSSDWRPPF